jgi:glycosyltransferase involved in cell wall biosynthesis
MHLQTKFVLRIQICLERGLRQNILIKTMKKKILIFSLDYYPGEVGGAEVAIKEITDRISSAEIEFHLLTLHYDKSMVKEEQIGNVHVHRIGFGWKNPTIADRKKFPLHLNKHLFQFSGALKALLLHRKYRYDGIWAMMAHSCGVPAALFKWFHPEVKFVLTLQEGDPPEHIERLAKPVWPLFKRAFTKADTIQVISTFLGRWAKRMGSVKEPILIPNAVNIKHFARTFSQEEIMAMKNDLGKKEGDVFIVTTSRIVPKNGLDDVVRAMPFLPSNIHFLIYGGGPDKEKLEVIATELGVRERVHFKGLIGHVQMPLMLACCDIFTRPSRSEGMGNSFVEAMAAHLPVIATQEGGIADFLFDAKRNPEKEPTGWAVDANAPKQIALAVKEIIENPETVTSVTNTAYELAITKYDWELIAKDMREKVFLPLLTV